MEANRFLLIFAALLTGVKSTGVTINTGDVYGYTSLYQYGITAESRDHIVFAVKACGHAHTALMSNQTDTTGTQYEVGIGGWDNKKSFIRPEKQGALMFSYDSVELDCAQFKIFWIKWSNGVISAGRGMTADQDKFLEYDFVTLHPINYLAVSTGWGASGEWLYNLEPPTPASTTSITISEGNTATLPCYTGGFPTPAVTWFKDTTQLPDGDPDFTVSGDGSLTLNNALPSRSGSYKCIVENIVDSVQVTHSLTVQARVNGVWSPWSSWGSCSATCGDGDRSRTRSCDNPPPSGGGQPCTGADNEVIHCSTGICDADGAWAQWSAWSSCSLSCGGGTQQRSRTCTNPAPAGNGLICTGNDNDFSDCNTNICPVDGSWSQWSSFQSCNVSCGGGIQFKTRTCSSPLPAYGGADCIGSDIFQQDCNTHLCPVHGAWSQWSPWSTCTATCGGGDSQRDRTCSNPTPVGTGLPCSGIDIEYTNCSTNNCPVDGSWGAWGALSACNASCGGGSHFKSRSCSSPAPAYGGADCPGSEIFVQSCNAHNCTDPVDTVGCVCQCEDNIFNITLDEKLALLRSSLAINKSTLSSTRRKLISVGDSRPSAQRIGYLGVALLCLTGFLLTTADVKAAIVYICRQLPCIRPRSVAK